MGPGFLGRLFLKGSNLAKMTLDSRTSQLPFRSNRKQLLKSPEEDRETQEATASRSEWQQQWQHEALSASASCQIRRNKEAHFQLWPVCWRPASPGTISATKQQHNLFCWQERIWLVCWNLTRSFVQSPLGFVFLFVKHFLRQLWQILATEFWKLWHRYGVIFNLMWI